MSQLEQGPMALDPGSRILDRGPRAPFWAMGYPKGPMSPMGPVAFLDGPGAFKALGGTAMLRWIGPGVTGARPLNGPWVKNTRCTAGMCVFISIWASARLSKEPDGLPKRQAVVSQRYLRAVFQWRPPNVVWKPRIHASGVVG